MIRQPPRSTLLPVTALCRALDWISDIPLLLTAVDGVVQNAGGFASLEALAAGKPTVTYRCISGQDRKSTRLNSSHANISYAVFCLKKKDLRHRPFYVYLNHI